jgi:hypothetical protein
MDLQLSLGDRLFIFQHLLEAKLISVNAAGNLAVGHRHRSQHANQSK